MPGFTKTLFCLLCPALILLSGCGGGENIRTRTIRGIYLEEWPSSGAVPKAGLRVLIDDSHTTGFTPPGVEVYPQPVTDAAGRFEARLRMVPGREYRLYIAETNTKSGFDIIHALIAVDSQGNPSVYYTNWGYSDFFTKPNQLTATDNARSQNADIVIGYRRKPAAAN